MEYVLAYDLGTGGTKASLFDENGKSITSSFESCETYYPAENFREQKPEEWWNTIVKSTCTLLGKTEINKKDIKAIGISGHSLGVVPVDIDGKLLISKVPIWSDARADEEAKVFFEKVDEKDWYMKTGNGFPAPLYSIFKIMWYKKHIPEVYEKAVSFIGTKDYINLKLTGSIGTDISYASGCGVFDLKKRDYDLTLIEASGIEENKLPKLYESDQVIGTLLPAIAKRLGLREDTLVVSGGVDNSCMALGAGCIEEGNAYTSLGTSAWIAVAGKEPVIEEEKRPYVFAHCIKGMYVSATAIFSAGNSYRWVRDQICQDLKIMEEATGVDAYNQMNDLAKLAPLGSNRLLFNPSLAGGSSLDKSANIRGGFIGLSLAHTRNDLIRASLEGICMNLRLAMDVLVEQTPLSKDMLIVGGGSKSRFWMQLFANIYEKEIKKTNVGQEAGSLGAASLAFVGAGIWKDYQRIKDLHEVEDVFEPNEKDVASYKRIIKVFAEVAELQCDIGDMLATVDMTI